MRPDAHHPTSEELFAYRDGELSHERRNLMEAHVLVCAQCRERIDEMSALESDLRMRPDDVGEEYYARLAEAVVARAGSTPREEIPEAEPVHPFERRRPDVAGETPGDEIGGRRRLRLPWIGIAGSGAAAAAVLIVAVVLFQRQGEWVRAPRPTVPGDREAASREPRARGGSPREAPGEARDRAYASRTAPGAAAGAKQAKRAEPATLTAAKSEAPGSDAKKASPGASSSAGAVGTQAALTAPQAALTAPPAALTAPPAVQKRSERDAPAPEEVVAGEGEAEDEAAEGARPDLDVERGQTFREGSDRTADRTADSAGAAPQHTRGGSNEVRTLAKGDANARSAAVPGAPGAPGDAYASVLREHSLPAVWNPSVSRDALLKAEPDLRRVYQTRRAGADSARIRLYLAEAERAKLGSPPDAARLDRAVNHYRRAISLATARGDAALAEVARRRLAQLFGVETFDTP